MAARETPRAAGQRPEGDTQQQSTLDPASLGAEWQHRCALGARMDAAALGGDTDALAALWPEFVRATAALPRPLTERLDAERLARAHGWDSSRRSLDAAGRAAS